VMVDIEPVRPIANPVTLAAMKAEPRLAGMKMFQQFRLSVCPIAPHEWDVIVGMGA
jgi:predicted RNA-binding protein with PUA-like domain